MWRQAFYQWLAAAHGGVDTGFQRLSCGFGRLSFFSEGVGQVDSHRPWIESLKQRPPDDAEEVEIRWTSPKRLLWTGGSVREGEFFSGTARSLGLPKACETARFALFEPPELLGPPRGAAVVLAGTGDHGYRVRAMNLAIPLARQGFASILLENVMYGRRKPDFQTGAKLRSVSDLIALGRTTIAEARSLLLYLRTSRNYANRLSVVGNSMGGLHAAMAASLEAEPVGVVAAYAPPSGVEAFLEGLMIHSMDKNVLPQLPSVLNLTSISNFPVRVRHPAILLQATHDRYVAAIAVDRWQQHWPHVEVRRVCAGHITGILLKSQPVVSAVRDVLSAVGGSARQGDAELHFQSTAQKQNESTQQREWV